MLTLSRPSATGSRSITFALPADQVTGPVSVVGTFNDWTPGVHVLRRRSNGTASVKVSVPAGAEVRFRYLAEGGVWFDDPAADLVDTQGSLLRV